MGPAIPVTGGPSRRDRMPHGRRLRGNRGRGTGPRRERPRAPVRPAQPGADGPAADDLRDPARAPTAVARLEAARPARVRGAEPFRRTGHKGLTVQLPGVRVTLNS